MAYTTIDDPSVYFQIELYTGTGSGVAHTFDGDTDLAPGLLWIKSRSASNSSAISDSVRGYDKAIASDYTGGEWTSKLASFDSDGFTTTGDGGTGFGATSYSGRTYVAWCWKESATAGFDIVSYTGDGTVTNISHSLSAVPELIIAKDRDATSDWVVYHHTQGNGKHFDLNNQDAVATDANAWNDTTPTSSVFTVGENSYTNPDSRAMIYYLFAPKQGYSKFGSYTGNSSTDGTFVYTGFSPSFLMIKCTSGTEDWWTFDNKRNTYNVVDEALHASDDDAVEVADSLDFLSNGFKWRVDSGARNATGSTYVYMAFAEAPFVNSGGVPANAR